MPMQLPEGKQSYKNSTGGPLVGGKLYTYDAGSSTPRITWSDSAGTTPNSNPIILDGRTVTMRENMSEQTTNKLAIALAKAQSEFQQIRRSKTVKVRTKTGGEYRFSYAPLEEIMGSVAPALSRNGICIYQQIVTHESKDGVQTTIMHESGEAITNWVPIFVTEQGSQPFGSGITYARRYGVTLLLCVCADDDDDGNAADGNHAEQVSRIDPRPQGWDRQDTNAVSEAAQRISNAINNGHDVAEIWNEYKTDEVFATALWAKLPKPVKDFIKDEVAKAK